MTWPWSMTAMSSARRSASSRYWVVSSTVVPAADELLDDLPQPEAAARVKPGGRLVEEQDRRLGHERGGQVQAPAHAARVGLGRPLGGVMEVEALEQLVAAPVGLRARACRTGARPWSGSRAR